MTQVGGVALWYRTSRSLTGELSLLYAWSMVDLFVGNMSAMGQPTRPTQPSISSGSVNE